MKGRVILDTGPWVAFLNRREAHHVWVQQAWTTFQAPLLTCEPVVTEVCFLVQKLSGGPQAVLQMVKNGTVQIAFRLQEELSTVGNLMGRYASVPMSLADACLVRMAEQHSDNVVFTLDSDFRIYRRHGRQVIPTIMPSQ